jgi:hypothetical protein
MVVEGQAIWKVVTGAIAQLGERLPCTQEVGGSIPPGSTRFEGLAGLLVRRDDSLLAGDRGRNQVAL